MPKLVRSIQSETDNHEKKSSPVKRSGATQHKLFENPTYRQTPEDQTKNSQIVINDNREKPEIQSTKIEQHIKISNFDGPASVEISSRRQPTSSKKTPSLKRIDQRKLQVSNGHYLDFNQLARLIYNISTSSPDKTLSMSDLETETGLPFRQVRNRISIGRAMGIFEKNKINLSPFGKLVSVHDAFFESKATLEYLHFLSSSNYENLIWYDVFNKLLFEESPIDYQGWLLYFRSKLSQDYTEHSLKDHLGKEIRFIIDAYVERNFRKLGILQRDGEGRLYKRRYKNFTPLVLAAMIYDFCAANEAHLFQVAEMASTPGSPAVVFGLDAAAFRQQIEGLHDRGWLRYETTHSLDQIRLKPGFCALEFLTAHFEDREPQASSNQSPGGPLL